MVYNSVAVVRIPGKGPQHNVRDNQRRADAILLRRHGARGGGKLVSQLFRRILLSRHGGVDREQRQRRDAGGRQLPQLHHPEQPA